MASGACASFAARVLVGEDEAAAAALSAPGTAYRASLRHLANVFFEEPDAGNLHVRIRGGPGLTRATRPLLRTRWVLLSGDRGTLTRSSATRFAAEHPARGRAARGEGRGSGARTIGAMDSRCEKLTRSGPPRRLDGCHDRRRARRCEPVRTAHLGADLRVLPR